MTTEKHSSYFPWALLQKCADHEKMPFILLELSHNELIGISGYDNIIWKYTINNNNWIKWIVLTDYHILTCSINKKETILYAVVSNRKIIEIDMKSKQIKTSKHSYDELMYNLRSLFINGQFHIFKGLHGNITHLIWNEQQQKLINVDEYHPKSRRHVGIRNGDNIFYLSKNKAILITYDIGWYDDWLSYVYQYQEMYVYSLITHKYTKLEYISSSQFAGLLNAVLSKNEKFLICFSVDSSRNARLDVLDLHSLIMHKTDIKVPSLPVCWTCLIRNISKCKSLAFGYVDKCWKSRDCLDIYIYPPVYLIEIIESYIDLEIIYLLNYKGCLWSIDVDTVLMAANIDIKHNEELLSLQTMDHDNIWIDPNIFNDASKLPDELKQTQLFVDLDNKCLICPIMDHMVPFHIKTIKNFIISTTFEGRIYLQIHFISPLYLSMLATENQPSLYQQHPDFQFIKELTYFNEDGRNLQICYEKLKILSKQYHPNHYRFKKEDECMLMLDSHDNDDHNQ